MLAKLLAISLVVGSFTGCDYIDKPKTRLLTGVIPPSAVGIQFGGDNSYLSAKIDAIQGECIPYREFVKVGDTTKIEYLFKVIVSARIQSMVLNKDGWPFSAPSGTLRFDLISKSKVVLGSQTVSHQFFIDGNSSLSTATFPALTEFDMERLSHVEVSWVYSR